MNNYEEAIKKGRTSHFLLGREEYFVPSKDWGGHDITCTQEDLRDYAKLNGEDRLYHQLEEDILSVLENEELETSDVKNICAIFWWYFINRVEEKKIVLEWKISQRTREALKKRIDSIMGNKEALMSIIYRIKDRFGYNLLED